MTVFRGRAWLVIEYLLLFFGAVGAYALAGSPGSPIPILVLLGAAAVIYLRRQSTFDRKNLGRRAAIRPALPSILALWAVAAAVLIVGIFLLDPQRLFSLPRQDPILWVAVMIFYPLVSVYPQELLFRAFLMHRYAPAFGTGRGIAAASALAFGFAHIIYGNPISVALTVVAGWLFARRYQRTRSLLATSVEHALYGMLVFTAGLGDLFYHGA